MPNNPTTSEPQSFNIVPTWSGIMPALLDILENPDAPRDSKRIIREQIMRLCRTVDADLTDLERAAAFDLDCG